MIRRYLELWVVLALLATLLVTLHLLSSAVQNSATLSKLFVPLLVINVTGLAILLLLIGINLIRLLVDYLRQIPGSQLTSRMVVLFSLLSVAPVTVIYLYSLSFLLRGIDSWFDVEIDQAMEIALELDQASLSLNQRLLLKYTEFLLQEVDDLSDTGIAFSLAELRAQAGANELVLLSPNGRVLGSSHANPTVLVPDKPDPTLLQQLRSSGNYVGLTTQENELLIRVLIQDRKGRPLLLQALYPTSERLGVLAGSLEQAYDRYKELAYLRQPLKRSFSLTLFLILLFSLLAAVWAAFYSARRLVAPIREIAKGTRAIAAGDYSKQLLLPHHKDELSVLVASFNAMTKRIAQARDQAARSQQAVEHQRAYLETVLGRLSSGVIAFDDELRLRTANPAAYQILKIDLSGYLEQPLTQLANAGLHLRQLIDALQQTLTDSTQEWRQEITLYSTEGRQVLLCRSSPFVQPETGRPGHVLVFDDITKLMKAQRDAAWGEVARRLAHEIKNPLTPIQLSAERLRRKYFKLLAPENTQVLDRATQTIIQQVEAMKTMVNTFSDYARPPKMQPEPLAMDTLVSDVLELYRSEQNTQLVSQLTAADAMLEGDPVRLRQVLHNLLKNAQEAVPEGQPRQILVQSHIHCEADVGFYELQITDNGSGFSDEILSHLFEPYLTTKVKGTGLGLAIVKKIIEEHGGLVWADNCPPHGGCVTFRLPLLTDPTDLKLQ